MSETVTRDALVKFVEGRALKVSYIVNDRKIIWLIISLMAYILHGLPLSKAARKDVERAFGVLQACFTFLHRPYLVWDKYMTGKIMIACIIIHNMIVEDERHTYLHYYD
uniref:Uncharacterized protein n=1 Tax=Lactuca sativa TaxID=4236 RepID=A0A9R1UEA9_LACSA|nr:hypothetical protein LSAT_V11C900470050 [Lactuca sativa]